MSCDAVSTDKPTPARLSVVSALDEVAALLDVQLRGLRECRLRRFVVPELLRYDVKRSLNAVFIKLNCAMNIAQDPPVSCPDRPGA